MSTTGGPKTMQITTQKPYPMSMYTENGFIIGITNINIVITTVGQELRKESREEESKDGHNTGAHKSFVSAEKASQGYK